jgi:hypothetical protein
MFRDAPEELPCTQHDQFAPIRGAMVKRGMARMVIAAAVIGMPNVKAVATEGAAMHSDEAEKLSTQE